MSNEAIAEISELFKAAESRRSRAISNREGGVVVCYLAGYVKGLKAALDIIEESREAVDA